VRGDRRCTNVSLTPHTAKLDAGRVGVDDRDIGDISTLAERFGYALARGQDSAIAIQNTWHRRLLLSVQLSLRPQIGKF